MPTFTYQPRARFDVESRIGQDREGPKTPKAAEETVCLTPGCGHPQTFHCQKFRRGEKPRVWLMVWNHENPRLRHPVRCKHFDPSRPYEPPLCNSSACAVADCNCVSFASPFRRPKKAAMPKPPKVKAPRKKRTAKPKTEQLALFQSPEAAKIGTDVGQ